MDKFKLTPKQQEAQKLLASPATHLMLFGGSRSGKTFLITRAVVIRALKSPGSRHGILRFRFNHVKSSIVLDTFPKVMQLCFPQVHYHIDKSDWYAQFDDGQQIWFGGLDDKQRAEKILGQEHSTLYLNECSQIPLLSRDLALTRLAQNCKIKGGRNDGKQLPLKMYYDCNPPSKAHWTYKLFHDLVDPDTKKPLVNPQDYASMQINPKDNQDNLPSTYLSILAGMNARMRKRFWDGEFADATPNQLFRDEDIDKWRVINAGDVPQLIRVVVAVDPSGSGDEDNADNDEIGIVAAGLGVDGNAYILADCTVKAGPGTWGSVAAQTYDRHQANVVVAEGNFGGAMVEHVIQTARPRTPFRLVTASRGKCVRAEPFSVLYEHGKVRHVGFFPEMEDELTAMSTIGYTGQGSPNRADATIWALAELFPALVTEAKKTIGGHSAYETMEGMGM